MHYSKNLSLIYDYIVLGIKTFNSDISSENMIGDFCTIVKKNPNTLFEEHLYPFFCGDMQSNPLIRYFNYILNYSYKNNMHPYYFYSYCLNSQKRSDHFKSFIIEDILGIEDKKEKKLILENKDNTEIFYLCKKNHMDTSVSSSYVLILSVFDEYIEMLTKSFKEMSPVLSEFYAYHNSTINRILYDFEYERYINWLKIKWDTDINNIKHSEIIISFFDKTAEKFIGDKLMITNAFFSPNKEDIFNDISIPSFIGIMNNNLCRRILEKLKNPNEMLTITQIARILKVPFSSARRIVKDMYGQMILRISLREAREVYYSINQEYFSYFSLKMSDFINKYC